MPYTEDQLKQVFAAFDKDNSGVIDCKELLTALLNLGKSEDEAKAIAGVSFVSVLISGD